MAAGRYWPEQAPSDKIKLSRTFAKDGCLEEWEKVVGDCVKGETPGKGLLRVVRVCVRVRECVCARRLLLRLNWAW